MTMKYVKLLAATALVPMVAAAAPKTTPASTAPIATYWMDVTTQSGMGMGVQPNAADMMRMMTGGGAPQASHVLRLRLASKTPAPAAPQADHFIPQGLRMGPSLPLVTPIKAKAEPVAPMQPKGRMLVYWGCGDHAGAGQPMVLDYAQMASGKVPESIKAFGATMGRSYANSFGPTDAPGFGEWPNRQDSRLVPPGSSLLGAHKIAGNYSPQIDFTLGAGQDFMAAMALSDGGMTPAGANLMRWNPVVNATGYAIASFGANEAGDTIMWSSVKSAGMANLDYISPGNIARAIADGLALPPSTTQCTVPAEVVRAMPMGMVMGVAYGPEVHFAEAPKNPKWAVTVRYRANASVMRGMGGMMGDAGDGPGPQQQAQPQPQPKKKRGLGLGDILGALPR